MPCWPWSTARTPRVCARPPASAQAQEVQRLLAAPELPTCRELAHAANTWAADAADAGAGPQEVRQQLDRWTAEFSARTSAPLVRIGLRLHPGAQLRMR